jgi:regulatory protein YycH of two-component signal transduction system YycFG
VLTDTQQRYLPSAREKVLGKEVFADALFAEVFTDALFAEPSLPSVTLGKAFAECF